MSQTFPTQRVLELACAAQRTNKEYLKESESVFDSEGKFLFIKHDNKSLVKFALGAFKSDNVAPEFAPQTIFINDEDKEMAGEIQKYFKRLMFSAVKGTNEFETEVNAILNSDELPLNKVGYVACLPSVYKRDVARNQIEKRIRTVDRSYLGDAGKQIFDKDCEVLESKRSINFDAFNITAIIDNKMVSWFSKIDLKLGACVVIKAKVKEHSMHWKHKDINVTRLNYVKAAQ